MVKRFPSLPFLAKPKIIRLDNREVVSDLIKDIDYFLVDCDGCCYLDQEPIAGAADALARLAALGKQIFFATNSGRYSRQQVCDKLNMMGFQCTPDHVITSSYACALYLQKRNAKGYVYLVGESGTRYELEQMGMSVIGGERDYDSPFNFTRYQQVQAAVVGMDCDLNLVKLSKLCTYVNLLRQKKNYVATNLDKRLVVPGKDVIVPDAGCTTALVQYCTGVKPVLTGKPTKWFFQSAKRACRVDFKPSRTAMIGDQYDTDMKLARKNGFKAAILVESGLDTVKESQKKFRTRPTHYIQSLGALSEFL